MEKPTKFDKNAQIGAILYAFNALKAKNIVKTQKDFADIIGVSANTLSAAIRGQGRYLNETLMRKIEDKMREDFNIDIYSSASQFFVTGDAISAPSAPADSSIKIDNENMSRLLDMLADRDKQINRLLTLLENEQAKNANLCQSPTL